MQIPKFQAVAARQLLKSTMPLRMDAADVLGVRQATTASHPCPAVVDEAASEDHALVERTMNHRSIIDRVRSDDCELLQREIFFEALY